MKFLKVKMLTQREIQNAFERFPDTEAMKPFVSRNRIREWLLERQSHNENIVALADYFDKIVEKVESGDYRGLNKMFEAFLNDLHDKSRGLKF